MNIFLQEPFFLYKLASWNLYFSRKEPFFTVSISYRNWHLANGLFSSFVSICFFPVSVLHTNWSLPKGFFTVIILHKLFLPSQYPAENYSLHFFPFQRSTLQRTIPYNFFSFPGSILQRNIPLKKSCGCIKHTEKSNFTSYRFFSLILAYFD